MNIVKNSKAFTLVELLLVVGIIALGSVVAYITFPKVQATFRANAEIASTRTLMAGIKTVYGNKNGFDGLSEQTLNNAKITPESWRVPGDPTIIRNSFGGPVNVANVNFPPQFFYNISMQAVPNAECSKIVQALQDTVAQMYITNDGGGFSVKDTINQSVYKAKSETPFIIDACSSSTDNRNNLQMYVK